MTGLLCCLRDSLILCASPFLHRVPDCSGCSDRAKKIALALAPLRGYVAGISVVIPLLILLSIRHLDQMFVRMLLPLLFCGITARLNRMRRINDYCRCAAAIHDPPRAKQIMRSTGVMTMTPSAFASAFFLLAGKMIVLYLLAAKFFVAGLKPDHQLLFDVALILLIAPALAETAAVLLLTGDNPAGSGRKKPGLMPLAAAGALLSPAIVLAVARISPNAAIMPVSLAMLTVFFWKHQADLHLGGADESSAGACYESAEFAALLGFLII